MISCVELPILVVSCVEDEQIIGNDDAVKINNNHDAICQLALIPDCFARHLLFLVLVPTTVLADTVIQ